MKNNLKRTLSAILCSVMVTAAFAGCNNDSGSSTGEGNSSGDISSAGESSAAGEKQTFKWFSPRVDRNSGYGLVEETLLKQYMEEHKDVEIVMETLENETYKPKLKAYIASDDIPDLFFIWTTPTWFDPVVKAGQVAEIDADFVTDPDQKFKEIAFDGCKYDDKYYAIPNTSEFYVVYYNTKIFADNNIEPPETYDDLLDITKKLRDNGIQPCSINGKEVWNCGNMVWNMLIQMNQEVDTLKYDVTLDRKIKFADYEPLKNANLRFKELADAGFFHDNWLNADWSEMYNMFVQGQTAMLYCSGEMADLNTRSDVADSVKGNIDCFLFPAKEGDKGKSTDMCAQYITGYALSSQAPQAAHDFLYWLMDRDNFAKSCWEMSGQLSAQDVTDFATEEEMNSLKGKVLNIQNNISIAAGVSYVELSTATFRSERDDALHSYWANMITLDEYCDILDQAADEAAKELQSQE